MNHVNEKKFYNKKFFEHQSQKSFQSANEVMTVLFDFYKPNNIIDFGCGKGTWLSAAENAGVEKLVGLDGDWVDKEKMFSKNIDFRSTDLNKSVKLDEKYDLAISLEVAEHLKEESSEIFVNSICDASDVVLFGAAIKNQWGVNHINEQWQSYWVNLFQKRGYRCYDVIRPRIWNNKKVRWWYKQNIFLFINDKSKLIFDEMEEPLYNFVHPDNYTQKIECIKNLQIQLSKKNEEITKMNQEISQVKKSKKFLIGDLFFRSAKNPFKFFTFPFNLLNIFLNK